MAPVIRHIAVVGLMGSGKTTIGSLIAAALGWPLRDSDGEIEAETGRTVRQLRDVIGADAMHELEARQLLAALANPAPSVVCAAASIADVDTCLEALVDPSVAVVFLIADPATTAERFRSGEHRPWYGDDAAVFLARQGAVRYPRFRSVNPIKIATNHRSPDEIASIALAELAARGLLDSRRD